MRSNTTRLLAALAATAVLGTGLAACSDDSGSSGESNTFGDPAAQKALEELRNDPRNGIYTAAEDGEFKHGEGEPDTPYSNNPKYVSEFGNKERPEVIEVDKSQLSGPYRLKEVIDGATFVLSEGEERGNNGPEVTVRSIGLDSPNEGERLYDTSKSRAESYLGNEYIFLESDPTQPETDEDGTRLAHLITDGYPDFLTKPSWEDIKLVDMPTYPVQAEIPGGLEYVRKAQHISTYTREAIEERQGYFYAPVDREPHKYAANDYFAEEQAAKVHIGVWEGAIGKKTK